jgi:hypothetical protein
MEQMVTSRRKGKNVPCVNNPCKQQAVKKSQTLPLFSADEVMVNFFVVPVTAVKTSEGGVK